MNKIILSFFCLLLFNTLNAQNAPRELPEGKASKLEEQDSLKPQSKLSKAVFGDDKEADKPKIQDYLIISYANDTTYVDTTLTIQKEYKFNYLRKDNFGLIAFSNLGQTYNSLTYDFENTKHIPSLGARARHFNFMEIEDINYYRVPTPLTELMYKTAFEQGQLLDAFFTVNTSPRFNFSIAYKGMRSIGKYQHLVTSTGNFRFTSNYRSENNRYNARGHIVTQDLFNEENGGLDEESVGYFETGEEEFLDRSILDVNFENAESMLKAKRFHLEHSYALINKKDSLSRNNLNIGHVISFEDKYFEFSQSSAETEIFGEAFKSSSLKDRNTLEHFYNQFQLNFSNHIIGDLQFNMGYDNFNYGYNKIVKLDGESIINRIKGDVYSAGGKYHKQYKGFDLLGELGLNISGDFDGNFLKAQASFKLNDDVQAVASLNHSSKAPNFNFLLYQSDYLNYNWRNNFNNTETQKLAFELKSNKIFNVTVDYSTISDYTYFKIDETAGFVKPDQYDGTINYLRVKADKEIKVGKLALNTTVMYQNVENGEGVLNVPELNLRSTLYYSSELFKKALFLQTGFTVNYFSKYNMNAYDPVLAEFYVQNDEEFGEFPRVDFFLNAKIRQTRIYLKAEHFNSAFTGYNYFSAPNNPYRDFTIRFGVVWNFFL
ncbi:putative porin [Algibacter miyuki]|uniref:Porin n=1 Tax=Algibacter miyuki TaxID=1306933 RepID=A0ABV5H2Y0_9FLAO|nr:putative porin [Algibacter miyuki]MDN3666265.1 putative porin [Algibacter miyuki]